MSFKPIAALLAQIIAAIGSNGVGGITGQSLQTQLVDIVDTVGGLAADASVYVSNAGSDATGDGTAGNPYASVAKAVEVLPRLDLNGFTYRVIVADGTYALASAVTIPAPKSYGGTSNTIYIESQSGVAANVVFSVSGSYVNAFQLRARTCFKNVRIVSAAGGGVGVHYAGIDGNFLLDDGVEFNVSTSALEAYCTGNLNVGLSNIKLVTTAPQALVTVNAGRVRLGNVSINWNNLNPTNAVAVVLNAWSVVLGSAWANTGTTTAAKYNAAGVSLISGYNYIGTGGAGTISNNAASVA